ncbi:hypothetical protein CANARDRAFT_27331 [[Candida] arabinofermentans NRRL YB-2248]|uniref:Anaphase-promoting complex subunit 4 WD40 domain-containing protein n=1 Tax=[Candida] arabinofermentans NRRL YB-2248 TaxID=983967 RepID=A0A1E4T5G1_9ASCO|nr:hypothetical protein CANARDRAFT_27331 [[Candida] arabinofermentans NRRL YB-2248]
MNKGYRGLAKRSSIAGDAPFSQQDYKLRVNDQYNFFATEQHQQLQQQQPGRQPDPQIDTRTVSYSSFYELRYPLYGLDWTNTRDCEYSRIALSSYREDATNRIKIIYGEPNYLNEEDKKDRSLIDSWNFNSGCEATVNYPVTRLQWDPSMSLGFTNKDRLATSSDCLRIYEVEEVEPILNTTAKTTTITTNIIGGGDSNTDSLFPSPPTHKLVEKMALTNSKTKNFNQLAPLTSFDWNVVDPKHVITCSIDTTCTLWDLSRGSGIAKTQLIAHDSEVFDVKFLFGDKYVFTSCSNDGSIRVFDLRSLEHSTIIYEPQMGRSSITSNSSSVDQPSSGGTLAGQPAPLLRLSTSNYNANHIATVEANTNRILILDLRYPGTPVKTLQYHASAINCLEWHPTKNMLVSGSDDCQVLIYDLDKMEVANSASDKKMNAMDVDIFEGDINNSDKDFGVMGFFDDMEVNNITWSTDGDWMGINSGRRMQAVKVEL